MATKRYRILAEIQSRLSGTTSALTRVYVGRVTFDKNDTYPLITIVPNDSTITNATGERKKMELPIDVIVAVNADHDNPASSIEPLIGEIKAALESGDVNRFYDFGTDRARLVHDGEGGYQHEDGSTYLTVSTRFIVQYIERVGNPDT